MYALEGAQDSVKNNPQFSLKSFQIVNWNLNQQLNMVTIVCKDEQSAIDLYNQLAKVQFKVKFAFRISLSRRMHTWISP